MTKTRSRISFEIFVFCNFLLFFYIFRLNRVFGRSRRYHELRLEISCRIRLTKAPEAFSEPRFGRLKISSYIILSPKAISGSHFLILDAFSCTVAPLWKFEPLVILKRFLVVQFRLYMSVHY